MLALLSGGLVGLMLGTTGGGRRISRDPVIGVCGRHPRSNGECHVADRRGLFRAFWSLAGKQTEKSACPCCLGVQCDRDAWRMAWGPWASTGSGNLDPLSFRKFVVVYQCMDVQAQARRTRSGRSNGMRQNILVDVRV